MRAFCRRRHLALITAALASALMAAPPAAAQVLIYDSLGFEAPTYSAGPINNQQLFTFLPSPNSGLIHSGTVADGTVFTGTQSFQIVGAQLVSTGPSFGDANFHYRSYTNGAINPVLSGNPIVRMSYDGYVQGALAIPSDIPYGGPYLEAYTTGGQTEAISPVLLNLNGGITVFTNTTIGGSDGIIATADGLIPRQTWAHLEAQFDFSTQSFRVLLNGTPVTFTEGAFSGSVLPFRNTFGPALSISEFGFQGYYNANFNPTFNNMYFDNVSAYAFSAVPEPSSLALCGAAVAGMATRVLRRKK